MSIPQLALKGGKSAATLVTKGLGHVAKSTATGTGKLAWNATKFGAKQFGKALKSNPLATLGLTAATAVGVPVVAGGAILQKALFSGASEKELNALRQQVERQGKQLDYLHGNYLDTLYQTS
jgi:hypothetical protein